MIAGRKPKPLELRVIEGNREARPLPINVPAATGRPAMPEWLEKDKPAVKLWEKHFALAPWLREADSEMFATWCSLQADFARAPRTFLTARITQIRYFASELGFFPSARTRMGTGAKDGSKDKQQQPQASKYFGK